METTGAVRAAGAALMPVARVQQLASSNIDCIPAEYIRPKEELADVGDALEIAAAINNDLGADQQIPTVDLQGFLSSAESKRRECVEAVARAATEWGVMQIVNHGLAPSLLDRVRAAGKAFFDLPMEAKESYANNQASGDIQGYGSKLSNHKSGKLGWTDYLFHLVFPEDKVDFSVWPAEPAEYRDVVQEFSREMRGLTRRVLAMLSLGLDLDEGRLESELGGWDDLVLQMKINYYPRCPQPELALGLPAHTDVGVLTFLMNNMIPGLQVYHDGRWLTVRCSDPYALVVNVGDAVEILSNGRYHSALHRGLVNREKVRISWAIFCEPPKDDGILLRPLQEVVTEEKPAWFAPRTFCQHIDQKLFRKKTELEADSKGF